VKTATSYPTLSAVVDHVQAREIVVRIMDGQPLQSMINSKQDDCSTN